jgi:hypothetical protein
MLVAEADGIFVETHDGKIFTYAAGYKQRGVLRKVFPPCEVVTYRITVNSFVRAAVNPQISLLVALKADRSDAHRTVNGTFHKAAQYTLWAKSAGATHMDRGHQCLRRQIRI